MTTAASEVWFLTGSQALYGHETLEQVASQSTTVATRLQESGELPVASRGSRSSSTPSRSAT